MVGLPRGLDGVEHEAELWSRNINECVAALLGNVDFQDHIAYRPTKIFKDTERTERLYGEAWTADWWWETQVSGPRVQQRQRVLTSCVGGQTSLRGNCRARDPFHRQDAPHQAIRRSNRMASLLLPWQYLKGLATTTFLPLNDSHRLSSRLQDGPRTGKPSLGGNLPAIPSQYASHPSADGRIRQARD